VSLSITTRVAWCFQFHACEGLSLFTQGQHQIFVFPSLAFRFALTSSAKQLSTLHLHLSDRPVYQTTDRAILFVVWVLLLSSCSFRGDFRCCFVTFRYLWSFFWAQSQTLSSCFLNACFAFAPQCATWVFKARHPWFRDRLLRIACWNFQLHQSRVRTWHLPKLSRSRPEAQLYSCPHQNSHPTRPSLQDTR
jgi:hypothetical protein